MTLEEALKWADVFGPIQSNPPDGDAPALMVLAAEVLVSTGSVRESIKRPIGSPPLKELMEQGQSMYGMQTFEMHIKQLLRDGLVDREIGRAAMGF